MPSEIEIPLKNVTVTIEAQTSDTRAVIADAQVQFWSRDKQGYRYDAEPIYDHTIPRVFNLSFSPSDPQSAQWFLRIFNLPGKLPMFDIGGTYEIKENSKFRVIVERATS